MSSYTEHWARGLLFVLYQIARALSLFACHFDRQRMQLKAQQQAVNKTLVLIGRAIIVLIYWGVVPSLFNRFVHSTSSYADAFISIESSSVSLFALASFIMQARSERKFIAIVNQYLALYGRISARCKWGQGLPMKFVALCGLKIFLTLCGCVNEIPPLLQMDHVLGIARRFAIFVGIYLWMGTLCVLDAGFLGFLVAGIMYEMMGNHIQKMLLRMRCIDNGLSRYHKMRLLCDHADELDACTVIYGELYRLTLSFRRKCQWQILFYIYYNFIFILLMLYECIWRYLQTNETSKLSLLMVCIKFANLVLLIMCADYTVRRSLLPQRLALDLVCTDIDERWDRSVESFLSAQKTQQLRIGVLGIFQLNNEFILVILSAIISYLFILIQFGMSGGFEESALVKQSLLPTTGGATATAAALQPAGAV